MGAPNGVVEIHMGNSFQLVLLYASFHRQDSIYHSLWYTSRGALAGTRNSSMGPAMKDRSDDPFCIKMNSSVHMLLTFSARQFRKDDIQHGVREWSESGGVHNTATRRSRCRKSRQERFGHFLIFDGSSDRSFMVDPLSYFSFQSVLHDWCNKGRCVCYPVCGIVHIKEPLLLIGKSSGSLPYVQRYITVK